VTDHPRDTEEGEVAESKRRGEEPEDLDEVLDDAVDDDALEDADVPVGRGGGVAIKTKSENNRTDGKSVKVKSGDRSGPFGRISRFVREVIAELFKVIWPTRKELVTYATVVVVFVAIMLTIVGLLDLGFAKLVLLVFGGNTKQ
jgi:preprotein translocase subunit SecE